MHNKLDQMRNGVNTMFSQGLIDSESSTAILRLLKKFESSEYHHRCASCYRWIDAARLGTVAIFEIENEWGIEFATCSNCAKRLNLEWKELSKRIENYLRG